MVSTGSRFFTLEVTVTPPTDAATATARARHIGKDGAEGAASVVGVAAPLGLLGSRAARQPSVVPWMEHAGDEPLGYLGRSLAGCDVDGDGRKDLAAGAYGTGVFILKS